LERPLLLELDPAESPPPPLLEASPSPSLVLVLAAAESLGAVTVPAAASAVGPDAASAGTLVAGSGRPSARGPKGVELAELVAGGLPEDDPVTGVFGTLCDPLPNGRNGCNVWVWRPEISVCTTAACIIGASIGANVGAKAVANCCMSAGTRGGT